MEMSKTYKPQKTIAEIIKDTRERYKKSYGRLMTEQEAIDYTEEARKATVKKEQPV